MKSIISRRGGKSFIAKKIIKMFPTNYDIYVEPFIGGGSILFEKVKKGIEVINDNNKDVIDIYRDIQKVNQNDIDSYSFKGNLQLFEKLKKDKNNNPEIRLFRNLYISKNSFLGNRLNYGWLENEKGQYLRNNLNKYQQRLKGVVIRRGDYKKVMFEFDSPRTFFYLDPPYHGTRDYTDINYIELFDILSKLEGKFLLSIDNSDYINNIIRGYRFRIRKIETIYKTPKEDKIVVENILSNY